MKSQTRRSVFFAAAISPALALVMAPVAVALDRDEVVYTFKTDDAGNIEYDADGNPIVILASNIPREPDEPRGRRRSASTIEDVRECETDSSSPDGRRASCRSGTFRFSCPPGHYLVRKPTNREHYHIISERGSENHYWIDWFDAVEIYPGTGIYVPTRVTWQVGARSNTGPNGSPGKTKAEFVCEIRKLPTAP